MSKLQGEVLTLPKMSGSVSPPKSLSGNVGAKTINIGEKREDGATFIPSVSDDGVISWTNDKDLPNPEPVNIKGVKGDKGDKGDRGLQGVQGIQGERGEQGQKGDKGDRGEQGIQGVQGLKGETGEQGQKGADGTPATHRWSGTTLYITSASGTSSANLKGEKGDPGTNGKDGADGYTPVKGVDYFDGENGIDGKDGYTPIKGVDYFDGEPGADGQPGKDGYTPQKGVDYFTPSDIAEIAGAVPIPDISGKADKTKYNNYSTDEVRIGTWIDGKPIYRKTLVYTNADLTKTNFWAHYPADTADKTLSDLNIETYTNMGGVTFCANQAVTAGAWQPIPRVCPDANENYNIGFGDLNPSRVGVLFGNKYISATIYFTIEYTKTTD